MTITTSISKWLSAASESALRSALARAIATGCDAAGREVAAAIKARFGGGPDDETETLAAVLTGKTSADRHFAR